MLENCHSSSRKKAIKSRLTSLDSNLKKAAIDPASVKHPIQSLTRVCGEFANTED